MNASEIRDPALKFLLLQFRRSCSEKTLNRFDTISPARSGQPIKSKNLVTGQENS